MNFIVFASGTLGFLVTRRLINSRYNIALLNCKKGDESLFNEYTLRDGINVVSIHPERQNLKLQKLIDNALGSDAPNALLSVNYPVLIPRSILSKFAVTMNVHGSLLPKYRGRSPHVWAIINGERTTGVTVHVMDEGIDTGPIVHQETVPIEPNYSGGDLLRKFEEIYPQVVITSIQKLEAGLAPLVQNNSLATYFGKRTPDMGIIDFRMPVHDVSNFIRALRPPYPGAYTYLLNGRKLIVESMILRADLERLQLPKYSPREVDGAILVRLDEGIYELREHIKESL